ncbi:MAG: hypothetical protein RBR74_02415 [Ignavibacteriaceae bacterium]|jgi:hypothetical protein|nr:hypothetical protein [Ignavibacteriaceae bacterium]
MGFLNQTGFWIICIFIFSLYLFWRFIQFSQWYRRNFLITASEWLIFVLILASLFIFGWGGGVAIIVLLLIWIIPANYILFLIIKRNHPELILLGYSQFLTNSPFKKQQKWFEKESLNVIKNTSSQEISTNSFKNIELVVKSPLIEKLSEKYNMSVSEITQLFHEIKLLTDDDLFQSFINSPMAIEECIKMRKNSTTHMVLVYNLARILGKI